MKWKRIGTPQANADTTADTVTVDDDIDVQRGHEASQVTSQDTSLPSPSADGNSGADEGAPHVRQPYADSNDEAEEEAPQQRRTTRWSKRNILDKAMDKHKGRASSDSTQGASSSSSTTTEEASLPMPSSDANDQAEEDAPQQARPRWSRRNILDKAMDKQKGRASSDSSSSSTNMHAGSSYADSAEPSSSSLRRHSSMYDQPESVPDEYSNLDAEERSRLPNRRASRWSRQREDTQKDEKDTGAAAARNVNERVPGQGGREEVAAVQNPFARLVLGPNAKMTPSAFYQAQEIKQMRNNRKAFATRNNLNRADGPNAQLWTIPEDAEA